MYNNYYVYMLFDCGCSHYIMIVHVYSPTESTGKDPKIQPKSLLMSEGNSP